ncbi:MAG: PDC sensor domain-containing protein [Campylobacterales bacterium]
MKEAIVIFKKNRATVESFLRSTIDLNHIEACKSDDFSKLFSVFPALELVYKVDNSFTQVSTYYYRDREDDSTKGLVKSHLFNKALINKDDLFISNPYISSHTGNPCITVVKPVTDGYIVFDFNLIKVLTQLKLLEIYAPFDFASKVIYAIIGFGLMIFSIFLAIYSGYYFVSSIVTDGLNDIKTMFTPIIALTLGLAIFDLSKTILEQEVFYKNHHTEANIENKILSKFLISIIIALSIEALMVVFKITLSDYSEMINALYLIAGISFLILSLGIFNYFGKKAYLLKRGE